MPELPEVETIRRDLAELVTGKVFQGVRVQKPKMVHGDVLSLQRQLRRQKVQALHRRGKLLIWELSERNRFLLVHLKMTGQLILDNGTGLVAGGHSWPPIGEMPNKHTHLTFTFTDRTKLYFNDQRQFGYVQLVPSEVKEQIVARYGVEPLEADFTRVKLEEILKRRKASVKSVLLNQQVIAGLGNIYADEACFRAGILPERPANLITADETARLWRSIREVLRQAIKYRGTTFNSYRDAKGRTGSFVKKLKVYGRGGEVCLKCGQTKLQRTRVGQRGTVYCPRCQT